MVLWQLSPYCEQTVFTGIQVTLMNFKKQKNTFPAQSCTNKAFILPLMGAEGAHSDS